MDDTQLLEAPISIEVALTAGDFGDFLVFHVVRSRLHRHRFVMMRAVVFVLYFVSAWLAFHLASNRDISTSGFQVALLCALPASAFEILTKPLFLRWRAKRDFRNDESLGAPASLTFTEDGISWSNKSESGFIAWSGIVDTVRVNQAIYLFKNSLAAFILPKRAFRSDESMDAFAQWAAERQRAARAA